MYEQYSRENNVKGSRCRICTGCGKCGWICGMPAKQAGGSRAMHVVTAQRLVQEAAPIPNPRGERLVTADIGTTTIALQLYDWTGEVTADYADVNPQVRFGADVLSRIQAAEDSAAAQDMCRELHGVLEAALESFREFLRPGESIRMVLAGNTAMIYLLMGYEPAELGRAPFAAEHLEAAETVIGDVPCVVFPGFSAFVGGDIAAGMYACGMQERQELTLLIDLGTNGEIVLGNRHRRIACATAAGPAFEGGVNRGVWGADMVSLIARLRREGIVDETGLLAEEYFDEGIRIGDVRVTQEAIRAIQLAKGAIGAGIRILMKEYGLQEDWRAIDRVVLAGGFGYYLNPEDAACIGLLPGELAERAFAGGNTALAGALRLGRELLSRDVENVGWRIPAKLSERLISGTEIFNLAGHPDFEQMYFRYMNLDKE